MLTLQQHDQLIFFKLMEFTIMLNDCIAVRVITDSKRLPICFVRFDGDKVSQDHPGCFVRLLPLNS